MELQVKQEGLEMRTQTTCLDAASCVLTKMQIDACEALLLDVIEGDQSLFLRYDEVNMCWQVVDPVLNTLRTTIFNQDFSNPGSRELRNRRGSQG
jgi:glucose-6-phosphate 1-dehydrogenase